MPKPSTLKRRAQRQRAALRRSVRVPSEVSLSKLDAILKDIYAPLVREMFNKQSILLERLNGNAEREFAGDYYIQVPVSMR